MGLDNVREELAVTQLLYYIQEPGYVGNSLIFWGENSRGYVTNMANAGKYSFEEAKNIVKSTSNKELKLWRVDYIDSIAVINIDSQHADTSQSISKKDL